MQVEVPEPQIETKKLNDPESVLTDDSKRRILGVSFSPTAFPSFEGFGLPASTYCPYAAIADSLGRVLLVDIRRRIVVKIWKGYREAQCSWILNFSRNTKQSDPKTPDLIIHLCLVIYAPRRGLLEIWHVRPVSIYREAIINVGLQCRLLSVLPSQPLNPYLGLPSPVSPNAKQLAQCFLLHENSGLLEEIISPLVDLTNLHSLELDKFIHILKSQEPSDTFSSSSSSSSPSSSSDQQSSGNNENETMRVWEQKILNQLKAINNPQHLILALDNLVDECLGDENNHDHLLQEAATKVLEQLQQQSKDAHSLIKTSLQSSSRSVVVMEPSPFHFQHIRNLLFILNIHRTILSFSEPSSSSSSSEDILKAFGWPSSLSFPLPLPRDGSEKPEAIKDEEHEEPTFSAARFVLQFLYRSSSDRSEASQKTKDKDISLTSSSSSVALRDQDKSIRLVLKRTKDLTSFTEFFFGPLLLCSSLQSTLSFVDLFFPSSGTSLNLLDIVDLFTMWSTSSSLPPFQRAPLFEVKEGEKTTALHVFVASIVRKLFEAGLQEALSSVDQIDSMNAKPVTEDGEEEEVQEEQKKGGEMTPREKEENGLGVALQRCDELLLSVRTCLQNLPCVLHNIFLINIWHSSLPLLASFDDRSVSFSPFILFLVLMKKKKKDGRKRGR